MGKLRSISLTTICKWATSNLPWLYWQITQVFFFLSPSNSLSLTRGQKGYPSKVSTSPHLANAFVWNLGVIHQSWQLPVKWRVTGVKAWHLYYGCLRSQQAWLRWEPKDLTVYKSVCLKVNRSEEVPRPRDPQVQLDNSIYTACAHNKGTTDREKEKIKEQAALLMTWKISFLGGQLPS